MSRGDNGRRTAVESEYTEEDDEYLEGVEDDDEVEDDGNVTFGEDDFSEAALLSRSPTGSGSLRSRRNNTTSGGESGEAGVGASSGRSSGHAVP